MYLSNNFTLQELTRSTTAIRKGINNIPHGEQVGNLRRLAINILQSVRDMFGPTTINSGYRCKKLNKAVKGDRRSYHIRGMAADIESAGDASLMELLVWIHENCEFTELIAEYFPSGWVHVAYDPDNLCKTLKLKDKNHNYKKISLEYLRTLYG